jgi:hypothetical protein
VFGEWSQDEVSSVVIVVVVNVETTLKRETATVG